MIDRRGAEAAGKPSAQQVTVEAVRQNEEIRSYIEQGDSNVMQIGYTEHGLRHANFVALMSRELLARIGYDERTCDLAEIAGYLHDIGNAICREKHAQAGALMAWSVLREMGMDVKECAAIASAIGNHEEDGKPVSPVSAAVIIADKSDVHRTRVRNPKLISVDIHDRVNYAATSVNLSVNAENRTIILSIEIDTAISRVMEYFEIFLDRMTMCQSAARLLGYEFKLVINNVALT